MIKFLPAILVLTSPWASPQRAATPILSPMRTFSLAGVGGRIDHMAVDIQHMRLFVSALGNGSVEVINLNNGARIRSLKGLQEPQGVVYAPGLNRLFVACGGDGALKIYDAASYKLLSTVPFPSDADNLRYDPATKTVYVGYGEGGIAAVDAATGKRLGEAALPGHPESFQLEKSGSRIFVNLPSARLIAVIDRATMRVIARWPLESAHSNFPMALDEADHRLFVGCRSPASLLVLDTESGRLVAHLPAAGDTDDVFYDAERKRIYLSGGEGFVDVFDQVDRDHYRRAERIPAAPGARTSFFIPRLHLFCLAVPERAGRSAEIRVFSVP